MVSTPAELRVWRAEVEATQDVVAQVLGVDPRSVCGWEGGEHMIPSLLPWALLAATPHVESLVAYNRRKDTAARKRRERKRRERRNRVLAAERRAVKLEAMRDHREELKAQRIAHGTSPHQFMIGRTSHGTLCTRGKGLGGRKNLWEMGIEGWGTRVGNRGSRDEGRGTRGGDRGLGDWGLEAG